jgi:hypothetical protein
MHLSESILLGLALLVSFARVAAADNFKRDSLTSMAEADFPNVFPVVNASPSENSNSTLCSNPVRGQCSFYEDCLETRYHCGPDGYPLGYGKKFCNKFNAARDKFSQKGQIWMLDTMECLQRVLVPEATGPKEMGGQGGSPCDELRKKAFDSHAECYVQNGVCTLSVKDWVEIVEVVDLKTLFGSWEALNEALQAATGCLELYAFLLRSLE